LSTNLELFTVARIETTNVDHFYEARAK